MSGNFFVKLVSPAKIGTTVYRPGETVRVTDAELEQLRDFSVPAEDEAALIANADTDLEQGAASVDWQARALTAEAQLKLLEDRVLELQFSVAELSSATAEMRLLEDERAAVMIQDQDAPQISADDSIETAGGDDQVEEHPDGGALPAEVDPEAAKTTPKAGRGKAKG